MSVLIGGRANVAIALLDKSFVDMGFNSTNLEVIFEVGETLKSWKPGRTINAIDGARGGRGYYVIPKINVSVDNLIIQVSTAPTYSGSVVSYP